MTEKRRRSRVASQPGGSPVVADAVPRDRTGTTLDRPDGDQAWFGAPALPVQRPSRRHQALMEAGQLIVEWAVEVARYEADLDWQWVHRRDDDPAVTASALARLIHDARSVIGRAEDLLHTVRPDDEA